MNHGVVRKQQSSLRSKRSEKKFIAPIASSIIFVLSLIAQRILSTLKVLMLMAKKSFVLRKNVVMIITSVIMEQFVSRYIKLTMEMMIVKMGQMKVYKSRQTILQYLTGMIFVILIFMHLSKKKFP